MLIITHLSIGLLVGILIDYVLDQKLDLLYDRKKIIFFTLIGSILPDIDSIFLLINGQEHLHRGILHWCGISIGLIFLGILLYKDWIIAIGAGHLSHVFLDFVIYPLTTVEFDTQIDQIASIPIIFLLLFLVYRYKKNINGNT